MVLILPSGTYRAEDFLRAAASESIEVIVASDQAQAMSASMGERALVVDLCDAERAAGTIIELGRVHPINAVLAVDDQGVEVAALAAAALGLTHNSPEGVVATRNKARMRALLKAGGVRQTEYRIIAPDDDVAEAAASIGFPLVLKPVSLSASRGVIRADDEGTACVAAARIRALLASAGHGADEPLLVERYVPGTEVAVEALVQEGHLAVLVVFDKPEPLIGPYFEETIYVTPSRLPVANVAAVEAELQKAVAALGLRTGVVHGEVRVDGSVPYVLEVAARSIGGMCSRAVQLASGRSLEQVILRQAVGASVSDLIGPGKGASGVMMIPIPKSGRLVGVSGLDAAREVPGVTAAEVTIPLGGDVVALPEGDRYLGFIFARADAPDGVEGALREAHACLTFDIEPTQDDEGDALDGPGR